MSSAESFPRKLLELTGTAAPRPPRGTDVQVREAAKGLPPDPRGGPPHACPELRPAHEAWPYRSRPHNPLQPSRRPRPPPSSPTCKHFARRCSPGKGEQGLRLGPSLRRSRRTRFFNHLSHTPPSPWPLTECLPRPEATPRMPTPTRPEIRHGPHSHGERRLGEVGRLARDHTASRKEQGTGEPVFGSPAGSPDHRGARRATEGGARLHRGHPRSSRGRPPILVRKPGWRRQPGHR